MLCLVICCHSYLHVVSYVLQPPFHCLFVISYNNINILWTYWDIKIPNYMSKFQ